MTESAPEGGDSGQNAGGNEGGNTGGESQVNWQEETEKWKGLSRKHESELEKVRKTAEANASAARELANLKRAGQSEAERLTSDLSTVATERDTFKSRAEQLTQENARLLAGLEVGLTLADMKFIPLGDPVEMVKAAKDLASRLGAAGTPPNHNGGGMPPPSAPKTMSEVIRAARGGGRSSQPT
jgi:hypothetical protein